MSPNICLRRWLTIVACCFPLLAFAGCGSSGSDSASTTGGELSTVAHVSTDPSVAALVPPAMRAKGALTIGTDPTYAPMEFIAADGKTLVGVDIELAHALTRVMGLKVKIDTGGFDGLIPGLYAGKYDVGLSAIGDTLEREKTLNFVTYLSAGSAFYTLANGGVEVKSFAELCGHSVAVQQGVVQQQDLAKQDAKCKQAGEPGVDILALPDQNAANIAISSGRAELSVCDELVADYAVSHSHGEFKRTGLSYGTTPYGIAVTKEGGLDKPILAALRVLMSDGVYKQILQHWHVTSAGIDNPKINGAINY